MAVENDVTRPKACDWLVGVACGLGLMCRATVGLGLMCRATVKSVLLQRFWVFAKAWGLVIIDAHL